MLGAATEWWIAPRAEYPERDADRRMAIEPPEDMSLAHWANVPATCEPAAYGRAR